MGAYGRSESTWEHVSASPGHSMIVMGYVSGNPLL
ncbi:Uncharacterised protein [Mycobacterium tuberculosis]|nr:Uncharacterised protein [Mycobacterium tuberculosis]